MVRNGCRYNLSSHVVEQGAIHLPLEVRQTEYHDGHKESRNTLSFPTGKLLYHKGQMQSISQ